ESHQHWIYRHAVCATEFNLCLARENLEGVFGRRGREPQHHVRTDSWLRHLLYCLRTDRPACRPSFCGVGLLAQPEAAGGGRCIAEPSVVGPTADNNSIGAILRVAAIPIWRYSHRSELC